MIDWFNLLANSLWILGCSIALATLSYASWQAATGGEKTIARLRSRSAQLWLNLSILLFCLGMAGTESRPIFIVVWLALAGWYLWQTFRLARPETSP